MEIDQAIEVIKSRGYLFGIGQLSKETTSELNKMVHKKRLKKVKAWWPYVTSGTCIKTMYFKGDIPE